jgi:hypothetical protein
MNARWKTWWCCAPRWGKVAACEGVEFKVLVVDCSSKVRTLSPVAPGEPHEPPLFNIKLLWPLFMHYSESAQGASNVSYSWMSLHGLLVALCDVEDPESIQAALSL